MNGQVLGLGAAALLVAAGLLRKPAGSPSRVNEDLAEALRAYRPPFPVGSAAKRPAKQISPQDMPGQGRLPGFTDPELIARGLMTPKTQQGPAVPPRRRRVKPVDVEAQVQRRGREALDEEMEGLAVADLKEVAPSRGEAQRRNEGPWELFLRSVPGDVSDEILVALLLADGTGDPVLRARELLSRLQGSLGQVVAGTFVEEVGGTPAAKARLIAAAELSRRAAMRQFFSTESQVSLRGVSEVVQFIRQMSQGPKEILSAIYLDSSMNVIGYRVLSQGDSGATIINRIEVLRPAVELRARSIIIGHQHPSGRAEPSHQDIQFTKMVEEAAKTLGIILSDHVIVGRNSHYSFAENFLLPGKPIPSVHFS
jgi:DNA repair protein RadC